MTSSPGRATGEAGSNETHGDMRVHGLASEPVGDRSYVAADAVLLSARLHTAARSRTASEAARWTGWPARSDVRSIERTAGKAGADMDDAPEGMGGQTSRVPRPDCVGPTQDCGRCATRATGCASGFGVRGLTRSGRMID